MSQEARARTAAYVKARRGRLGLRSQRKLAELAGVDPKTINSLETGRRWPQPAILAQIEQALGWKSGSLQTIHDGGEPTLLEQAGTDDTDSDEALINSVRSLSKEEKDFLLALIGEMTRRDTLREQRRGA